MLTTSPDTGADNWWLAVGGGWLVVGGWWWMVGGCWWWLVGGWWLVVGGWWWLVGGWWLVVVGWRLLVGGGRRAPSAAPAMQITPAQRRRPRSTRAYIRQLGEQCCACHANHVVVRAVAHGPPAAPRQEHHSAARQPKGVRFIFLGGDRGDRGAHIQDT